MIDVIGFIMVIFFCAALVIFGPALVWTFAQVFVFRTHEIVPRKRTLDFEPYRAAGVTHDA